MYKIKKDLSLAHLLKDECFQEEWLPVGVQTWSPVKLDYSVAHYSWTMKGFSFHTDYSFSMDHHCGYYKLTQHSGLNI